MSDKLNNCVGNKAIPKYILHYGYLISKNDQERHFISARILANLYGVSMKDCVVQPDMNNPRNIGWSAPKDAIHLHPSQEGDYTLPNTKLRRRHERL